MSGRNRKIALALLVTALVALTITSVTAASQPPASLPETSLSPTSFSASSTFAEDNPLAEEPSLVALHPKGTLGSNALSDVRAVESETALRASLAVAMEATRLSGNPIPLIANGAPYAGEGPGSPWVCDPWIIELARDTVESNAPALEGLTGDVVANITAGDLGAIETAYAPDEEPLDPLGTRWPSLTGATPLTTVNVFLHDGDLVYFAYALVTWTDADLGSEHTVCIPLRFIDGAWYLTTIDDTTDGLKFVTSVRL